jgi:hypothetical protein
MVRILFCILAFWLSSVATAALAEPLQIVPEAVRSAQPSPNQSSPNNARYAESTVVSPVARLQRQSIARTAPARAYLMRGFMNIFSLGIDDLGAKIQANGIATTVANHADAEIFVNQIAAHYQAGDRGPIVLIGHSLGADATIEMAQALDRYDIPVALVILFDGMAPHAVPKNVTTAINFTQQFELSPGLGFHGAISNVDLRGVAGIDHLSIDKAPGLQAKALDYVLQAVSVQPGPQARRP